MLILEINFAYLADEYQNLGILFSLTFQKQTNFIVYI